MNFKHTIAGNLGFIQWLLTWLICIGMFLAGYFLFPQALEKHNALFLSGASVPMLVVVFGPLIFLTLLGSGLIALIWQFRFVKKEQQND